MKTGRKQLGFLLTLAMFIGLVAGISTTAKAAPNSDTMVTTGESTTEYGSCLTL